MLLAKQVQGLGCGDGTGIKGRRLAAERRAVGQDAAAAARKAAPPAGLPQPARARPRRHGRDPVGAAHRHAVERAERHGHLLVQLGLSTISRVGGRRCVRGVLARRALGVRPAALNRLELAGTGLCDDQGAFGRGKKPAPTPPTAPKAAPSAACWPARSGSPRVLTSRCPSPPAPASSGCSRCWATRCWRGWAPTPWC